jgi:hypothetical protein
MLQIVLAIVPRKRYVATVARMVESMGASVRFSELEIGATRLPWGDHSLSGLSLSSCRKLLFSVIVEIWDPCICLSVTFI